MSKADFSKGLDHSMILWSSWCAEPFFTAYREVRYRLLGPMTPGHYGNSATTTKEFAIRCGLGAATFFGSVYALRKPRILTSLLALGIFSRTLRYLGFALQTRGYTYVQGNFPETPWQNGSCKLMSWNVCGMATGWPRDHGGLEDWSYRVQRIADLIKKENPDVLVLQEIFDTRMGEALISLLKDRYSHFFLNMGQAALGEKGGLMGVVGGLLIATRNKTEDFHFEVFEERTWHFAKGFGVLTLKTSDEEDSPTVQIIGTHLQHGNEPKIRKAQVDQIIKYLAKNNIPSVVTGDFNIELGSAEANVLRLISPPGYKGEEPTCTNIMQAAYTGKDAGPEEFIDDVLFYPGTSESGVQIGEIGLVRAFDKVPDPRTALSDHHALLGTLSIRNHLNQSSFQKQVARI